MMQRLMKDGFVVALAVLAALYLINPTAGFLEFLPDNLPLIGNLDEATATLLLLNALRYFGLDLSRLFGRNAPNNPQQTVTGTAYRPDSRR
jgi:hypothetical protein